MLAITGAKPGELWAAFEGVLVLPCLSLSGSRRKDKKSVHSFPRHFSGLPCVVYFCFPSCLWYSLEKLSGAQGDESHKVAGSSLWDPPWSLLSCGTSFLMMPVLRFILLSSHFSNLEHVVLFLHCHFFSLYYHHRIWWGVTSKIIQPNIFFPPHMCRLRTREESCPT